MVTSLLFCDASIDLKWIPSILSGTKIAINFKTAAFSDETRTDSLFKVAVAESTGYISFFLRSFH
jgi:hypothetical protein